MVYIDCRGKNVLLSFLGSLASVWWHNFENVTATSVLRDKCHQLVFMTVGQSIYMWRLTASKLKTLLYKVREKN